MEFFFKDEGKIVSEQVFKCFKKEYGEEMANALTVYKNENFNVIYK